MRMKDSLVLPKLFLSKLFFDFTTNMKSPKTLQSIKAEQNSLKGQQSVSKNF